ncbi:MAG: peptide chain release factor 2 [Candidatus Marinimicrobia bacterium]|nr:peptide chain release factor 2 [Candidatus Neomarinimicrobiota bacterium]
MKFDIREYKEKFNNSKSQYHDLRRYLDQPAIQSSIIELQSKTTEPDFWEDGEKAQKILKKISSLENELKLWNELDEQFQEVESYLELLNEGEDVANDAQESLNSFESVIERVQIRKLLSGNDDHRHAILTIHPGAGGTESQDWASMLFRLYTRYCERSGFKTKLLDYQDGDEAGIKDVSIEISGDFAYGHLKAERGVHRLVRISPFDSNSKRHTSFASVFIFPVIDDDVDITIEDKDIRIDTYRASGAGGQHVNKTDSAVRITHSETGIVVQCQNERSQLKNKNMALKMLKARLYQQKMEEIQASQEALAGQKKDIGWGSQIRSYVFHPYNMVKDHRTKFETSNIQSVMDGNIDEFINAYLLTKLEK